MCYGIPWKPEYRALNFEVGDYSNELHGDNTQTCLLVCREKKTQAVSHKHTILFHKKTTYSAFVFSLTHK